MKLKKKLYDLEKQTKLSKEQKKYLNNLIIDLEKKLKYKHNDFHDQNYIGIRDIAKLYNNFDNEYYKPMLTSSAFNNNHTEYEIRGDKNKNFTLNQYIIKIKPHIINLINQKWNSTNDEQKIQLIIVIVFRHTTDSTKNYTFYVRSKNIVMLHADNANDIFTKLLNSFYEKYEQEQNILRNGSNYVFDYVDLSIIKFHTIELKRGSSYIPSPKWILDKKAAINPKNLNDNMCFAYAIIAALHYEEINYNPERISKLKRYINNYNWKDIKFPSTIKDWTTFEKNNANIALNILSASSTEKTLHTIRRSIYNNTRNKQVNLLMITNNTNNNWHYTTIKSISRLLRGITSNNHGDFYWLNCLNSFRTKNKLINHEKLCRNHDHCEIIMPEEPENIIKFNSFDKSIHSPHIIYPDLETLLYDIQSCKPNKNSSYTEKTNIHIANGYALNLVRTYDKNLLNSYRGTDCIQKFVKDLAKY